MKASSTRVGALLGALGMLAAGTALAQSDSDAPASEERPAAEEPMVDSETAEEAMPEEPASAQGMDRETPAGPVEGRISMQDENTLLASDLMGATIHSPSDESIGEVGDMIVDLDGTVQGVVIGVGGFLGMGEKAVAIEMSSLELTPPDDTGEMRLTLSTTREELEAAPEFVTMGEQRDAEAAEAARQDMEQNTATPMTPATDPAMTPTTDPAMAPAGTGEETAPGGSATTQ